MSQRERVTLLFDTGDWLGGENNEDDSTYVIRREIAIKNHADFYNSVDCFICDDPLIEMVSEGVFQNILKLHGIADDKGTRDPDSANCVVIAHAYDPSVLGVRALGDNNYQIVWN